MNIMLTGANGNLGRVVCRHLLESGHRIEAAVGPGSPLGIPSDNLYTEEADLMREDAAREYVERVLQRRDRVHAAVLLAGGFGMGKLEDTDNSSLDRMIDLNFRTAFHLVRPLLRHFEEKGGGRFIFIASKPVFEVEAGKDLFAYALSKGMLLHMAQMINAGPPDKNVTAAVIAPSIIDTPPNRKNMPGADPEKWVPPARIAETIAYLLSPAGMMLREPVLKVYNHA